MEEIKLTPEYITFGKYKDKTLSQVLKDRSYCKWLLEQPWFQNSYEYLYNRLKEYDPKIYFFKKDIKYDSSDFINSYKYFNLKSHETLENFLSENELRCYIFYIEIIDTLKNKIIKNIEELKPNIYDIKAPVNWLKNFETKYELKREQFKEFINSYELENIPYIIEDIKKQGGIEYKGAKSFKIAKQNSKEQEAFWEKILKDKFGEDISTQYKYEKCIFDFININSNTIFECKLSLKDFNLEQFKKYIIALREYKIIYLIDYDCIINIEKGKIYTTDLNKYKSYQLNIPLFKHKTKFDDVIEHFDLIQIDNLQLE